MNSKNKNPSIFGLLDCNNFYVSCERVFQPQLENRPVIVLSNNDGCVISRSNEAKKLHIKMGEPLFKIKDSIKKNKIHVFSSNFSLYGSMSSRVMESLKSLVPVLEIYSIDEAFLDFSTFEPSSLQALAKEVVKKVHQWTGVPVSLGLGPTKTLAKVANYWAKANQSPLFQLTEENTDEILAKINVEDVWGIGRKWSEKLKRSGINTALQLSLQDSNLIRKKANIILSNTVLELQGVVTQGIETTIKPKKQIIVSRSLGRSVDALSDLKEAVSSHTTRAIEKLRKQNSVAESITIFLLTNRFSKTRDPYYFESTQRLSVASQDTRTFLKHALQAVEKLYSKDNQYKKAGVVLNGLMPEKKRQLDLFTVDVEIGNSKILMNVLDSVNKRMGKGKLFFGSNGLKKAWRMRSGYCSPRYTTQWGELPVVR